MFCDISFEYDCCSDEFIYDGVTNAINGDLWISYHTEAGKHFIETYGLYGNIHQRCKVSNKKGIEILNDFQKIEELSGTYFGFYWLDKEHTKHV